MEIQAGLLAAGAAAVLCVVGYVKMYNKLRRLWIKVEEGRAGIDVALEKRFDLLSEELEAVKKYMQHEEEVFTSITEIRSGVKPELWSEERRESMTQQMLREADAKIREHSDAMRSIRERMEQSRRSGGSSARSRKRQAERADELRQRAVSRDVAREHKINLLAGVNRDLSAVGAGIDALAEQYPTLYSTANMQHFQRSIYDAEEHLQAARRLYNANASAYNQMRASFPFSLIAALHGMDPAWFYETEDEKRTFQVKFD